MVKIHRMECLRRICPRTCRCLPCGSPLHSMPILLMCKIDLVSIPAMVSRQKKNYRRSSVFGLADTICDFQKLWFFAKNWYDLRVSKTLVLCNEQLNGLVLELRVSDTTSKSGGLQEACLTRNSLSRVTATSGNVAPFPSRSITERRTHF